MMDRNNSQKGVMIITVAIFALFVMITVSSLVGYTMMQMRKQRQAVGQTLGVSIAEAAIEAAIWKLNNQPGYSGETGTTYGGGEYNVTITGVGNNKLIKAEAFVPNAANPRAKRVIQITASSGTTNVAFNYGVQVGQGGLTMANTSRIIGNVYSNGNIDGENSASITGTVIAAGVNGYIQDMAISGNTMSHTLTNSTVSGNANHYSISDSTVTGNASASSLSSCTITGDAVYNTKSSCSVGGTSTTPNPDVPDDPETIPLPITAEQITLWEQEAVSGGTLTSRSYSSGTNYLGPKKINGNLTVSNTATLIITGTLWVTGTVTFSNTAQISLDSSYGAQSGVIVAGVKDSATAGYIDLNNSISVSGSGTAGSYLMLLSQRSGTSSIAIDAGNTGTASILYAGTGRIRINNSGSFKEITAALLDISNSATITYETGLANSNFSSGPSGGWELLSGTWQLIQ